MKKTHLILSLLLLAGFVALTSCSDASDDNEVISAVPADDTAEVTSAPAEETPKEKTTTDIILEKYADTDLGGFEYKILSPGAGVGFYSTFGSINEVYADETNGEPLNDAIWERNNATEELLNVTISPIWSNGNDDIRLQLQTEVTAGITDYSAVINNLNLMGTSMANGNLLNLNNISSLDSKNAWWDKNIVDSFTLFDDRLYFISGDINYFDDYACEVLFFNKSLATDSGLEYPYSDVLEGKWTIDKFYTMVKAVETDIDNNGKLDPTVDVVGHCEVNDHIKHWLYAMGEKCIVVGEDGELTPAISDERHINVIDTLFDYMVNRNMTQTATNGMFPEGRILFLGSMLGIIGTFRDMDYEFGVIPMPKLDEQQKYYREYVSNGWSTAYGVPMTNISEAETIGTVLEVLCGLSTDTLRSALYDILFAAKFVRDTESVQMLDIIFESKAYDWATDFTWGSGFANLYNGIYSSGTNTFSSNVRSNYKSINKVIRTTFDKIKKLQY